MKKKPGLIRRFFGGFWRGVTASRRFIGNLIFLVIIIIFLSLFILDYTRKVPQGAALILSPIGDIVEQTSETETVTALFNEIVGNGVKGETLLKDIIDVIDYAKDDSKIKALVLDLKDMGRAGISKLQDIGAALKRFRASGKQIMAVGDYYNQEQYFLAAHANRIYLHPMGGIMLLGYGQYRDYFKSALQKLKVQLHIFRVGKYKTAIEPLILDSMSDEAKEANMAWLSELWNSYTSDVTASRRLEENDLVDYINDIAKHLTKAKGDPARLAINQGLVDVLKSRDEVREELIVLIGKDKTGRDYKQIQFEDYLDIIRPVLYPDKSDLAAVGVIVARGLIVDGKQPMGMIGSDSLAQLIRQARNDDRIESLVLRIDSGGGSAFASEIIRREIELTRLSGKPVVVSMGAVAASGGYWIATPANEIWATPTSITGSIGIFGAFPTFEKTLKSLGIHNDGVGTTKLADAFDPRRPLDPMVSEVMQQIVEQAYRRFINHVASGRNMSPEAVDKIAQGRIWSGKTAKDLGLVDKLGSLQDAIASAAKKAALDDYEVRYMKQPSTLKEKFIHRFRAFISRRIDNHKVWQSHPAVRLYHSFTLEINHILQMKDPHGLYAYCINGYVP
jgi:protease-4